MSKKKTYRFGDFNFKDFWNIAILHNSNFNIFVLMKKKIHKYDFLIIGGGLIGSIAAVGASTKKF